MSVLIKGMKMPKSCASCRFNGAYCYAKGDEDAHSTLSCPLVPVPDHGDLIDRNMLIGGFADWYIQESPMYLGDNKVVAETIWEAMKEIEAAPVVIPAERSEE